MKFRPTIKRWTKVKSSILLILAVILLPLSLAAQNKKDLEEKRKKIIRDIVSTEKMLKKTSKTKEAAYDRFLALQNQIESRETLIQTYASEISESDQAVQRNTAVISALTNDISQMQEEYGKMVRSAYRRKMLSNPLLYILSAENLNQAFRRWLFLRKYDQYRRQQADAIRFTREMLAKKIIAIEESRVEKEELLLSVQGQKSTLTTELVDKDELLKTLQKDEQRLQTDLEKKQQTHEQLNSAIERIIQEEVRKRVEESRKTKPTPAPPKEEVKKEEATPVVKNTKPEPKPEVKPETNIKQEEAEDAESFDFRKSKGRLPWPVESGFISRGFGKQKHPTLKNLEISNNGIDIRTEESAAVRAICSGKVAAVQFVPGHDYTVIIQHGDYYSVYTNLSTTSLSKGEVVKAKQNIGRVSYNTITEVSELHFEIWHQKERVNPTGWIKK